MIKKIALSAALFFISAQAQEQNEYSLFEKISSSQDFIFSHSSDTKYEVILFFNYNCRACGVFEPIFENWENNIPDGVSVKSVSFAPFDEWRWANKLHYAKAFLDTRVSRADIFKQNFLTGNKVRNKTDASIVLMSATGDDKQRVEAALSKEKVNKLDIFSQGLAKSFNVTGTPNIILNTLSGASYKIGPQYGANYYQMVTVLNGLITFDKIKNKDIK